jgi:thiamine biosynthesis lipoprotein
MVLTAPISASEIAVRERVKRSAKVTASDGLRRVTFQCMSTTCQVAFQAADARLASAYIDELLQWIAWFESYYSRFISDSLISRINAAAGINWVEIDPETEGLFRLCEEMIFFTRGVFDPTSLPLIRLWNWKAQPPQVPTDAAINTARELVGWRKVQRKPGSVFLPRPGMCLDLGGIGKEYAVDRVLTMAADRGLANVLVDFGQDVRVRGNPPGKPAWHIGLEDPKQPGRCWNGVGVTNHAVTTSGDYVRHFVHDGRRFGHIIDPRTGYPVENGAMAVTVVAPNCTVAGIMSTTAFILGPKEGIDLVRLCPGAECCITTENGRFQSNGFYAYTTS